MLRTFSELLLRSRTEILLFDCQKLTSQSMAERTYLNTGFNKPITNARLRF